jgi:UDP-N-acetylglucosamine acyltransferase
MRDIHPTAVVDASVQIDRDVRVGPYAIIQGRVSIAAGTVVEAHSVIRGHTVIGANCRIGPAAYVGLDPQHLKFDPTAETSLVIGEGTIIRETASVHRSMKPGIENATRVGKRCFIMAAAHVGHDCRVGDDVVLAHGIMLGGHVEVGDRAFIGGGTAVHQFCRIGRLVIVRGNEIVTKDLPPFAAASHDGLKAYNAVGCRRAGISRESIRAIRSAYRCIHSNRVLSVAVESIRSMNSDAPEIRELLEFIASSKRGIPASVRSVGRTAQVSDDEE